MQATHKTPMKKRNIFNHIFLFLTASTVSLQAANPIPADQPAQRPQPQALYPDVPPVESNGLSPDNITVTADVLSGAVEADYFIVQPDPDKATGQAVVICPGGGYGSTCYGYEGLDPAEWFRERGIFAFVLRYRMPNGHYNIPLADVRKAMQTIRAHAEEWHIDPNQIGIMGFSAGGHLAASASTLLDEKDRPNFTILFYPVLSMDSTITHAGSRRNLLGENPTEDLVIRFSPDKQVTEQTPPAFIATSTQDKSVPPINSVLYYLALEQKHIPAELHIFPQGYHGFALRTVFAYYNELSEALSRWMKELNSNQLKRY